MRISILGTRGYPSTYGGFETFVRRLAPWLAGRGHEVTVYGRSEGRRSESVVGGIRVVQTRGSSSKGMSTVSHGLAGALDCVRDRPDVVLALNVANGLGLPLLKARGIPVVMNVDGIEWHRAKWGPLARAGFRLGARVSARYADSLVADSQEIARVWRDEFSVSPVFIPYGGDVVWDLRDRRIAELGLHANRYAVVVARLAPENNVELFLDAMESLNWLVPTVVVGSANYDNPIQDRLARLTETGSLLWLGHVADQELLSELWANAGVYFHGHSVGGTNPALLQALGLGAPTLALDTPYNREVIVRSDLLVPRDKGEVAARIVRMLDDPVLRRDAALHGRTVVAQRYDWDDVCRGYEALLIRSADASAVTAQADWNYRAVEEAVGSTP